MILCWLKEKKVLQAAGTTLGFFLLFSSSDLTLVSNLNNASTLKELYHVLYNTC